MCKQQKVASKLKAEVGYQRSPPYKDLFQYLFLAISKTSFFFFLFRVKRKRSVQDTNMFVRLVTSIPNINKHDANTVICFNLWTEQTIKTCIFFYTVNMELYLLLHVLLMYMSPLVTVIPSNWFNRSYRQNIQKGHFIKHRSLFWKGWDSLQVFPRSRALPQSQIQLMTAKAIVRSQVFAKEKLDNVFRFESSLVLGCKHSFS